MKKAILFILLFVSFSIVNSQSVYFNKKYDLFSNPNNATDEIEGFYTSIILDTSIFSFGGVTSTVNNNRTLLTQTNTNGIIQNIRDYNFIPIGNAHEYLVGGVEINETLYIVGSGIVDSGHAGFVLKSNRALDSLKVNFLRAGFDDYKYGILPSAANDHLIVYGWSYADVAQTGQQIYIQEIDTNLNLISQHNYGTVGYSITSSLQPTPDGGYIMGGSYNTDSVLRDLVLWKLDSAFNTVWRKQYGHLLAQETQGDQHSLLITADSGFIIAGTQVFLNTSSQFIVRGFVVKTDKEGNQEWEKKYANGSNEEYLFGILPNGNTNYVLLGNTADNLDSLHYQTFALLCKINGQGDTIWQRGYKYYYDTLIEHHPLVQDFMQMSDGGYLISGYLLQNTRDVTAGWLVRVDSCGYFEQDTTHAQFTYSQIGNNQISFTNTTLKLCSWQWYFSDGDTSFVLNPTHQFADTGDYLITLITRAADFTDTAIVWIHISAPNAVQEVTSSSFISVYPNPATENINFKIYLSPEQTVAEVKIYNAQGALVYRFATKETFSSFQWNVKNIANGIYFYEVTGSQSSIAKGKVAVQH